MAKMHFVKICFNASSLELRKTEEHCKHVKFHPKLDPLSQFSLSLFLHGDSGI